MRADVRHSCIAGAQTDLDDAQANGGVQICGDLQAEMVNAGSGTNEVMR